VNAYPDLGSRSAALYERACQVLPGGNSRTTVFRRPYPIYAARGEGHTVIDADGVPRLDFVNNQTSLIHGHAHPRILEAASRAMHEGTCFSLPTAAEIELAERLVARCRTVEEVRFTNSGSEAVLIAIKAARAFTGRPKIAKCVTAYHGLYDHVEVSLDDPPAAEGEDPPRVPYTDGTPRAVLDDTIVLPVDDAGRAVDLVRRHADELAAVVLDPLPKRAGLVPLGDDFCQRVRAETRRLGIVLIVDEVISFRLAHGGAQERFGVDGDLTTFGKVIGGGFPVGAVGGRRDVMTVFDPRRGRPPVRHAGTFNANPVSMRAGAAALDLLDADALALLDELGDRARAGIESAIHDAGLRGTVTGAGSLFKIHLGRDPAQRPRRPSSRAESEALVALSLHLLNHGVLLTDDCFGAISTPMGVTEIDTLVERVGTGLRALAPSFDESLHA